jgi:hypothetical protein
MGLERSGEPPRKSWSQWLRRTLRMLCSTQKLQTASAENGGEHKDRFFTELRVAIDPRGATFPFVPAHRARAILEIAARVAIVLVGIVILAAWLP